MESAILRNLLRIKQLLQNSTDRYGYASFFISINILCKLTFPSRESRARFKGLAHERQNPPEVPACRPGRQDEQEEEGV
jgi:hypothetical protein